MDHPISDPGSRLHNGRFTDGDSAQGILPSIDKAEHMNAVYDEIKSVITAGGLTPNETKFDQLLKAIQTLGVPAGVITLWSGADDGIPSGWALCDGQNGTPDMRDRFVVGSGGDYDTGDIGGADSKNTSSNGSHSHSESSAGSHVHTSQSAGSHNHGITVNNHTLSKNQMPAHSHTFQRATQAVGSTTIAGSGDQGVTYSSTEGGSAAHNHSASSASSGTHSHTINSNGGHSHTINSSGSHNHSIDVRPRYYSSAFIIKLPI